MEISDIDDIRNCIRAVHRPFFWLMLVVFFSTKKVTIYMELSYIPDERY